jgi:hypothetical protein
MLVKKYMDALIPVLSVNDTVKSAIKKFEESNLNQLPVVDGEEFLGILLRSTAEGVLDPKAKLNGIRLEGKTLNINPDTHILEALKIASENELNVIGVVDATTQRFEGAVTQFGLEDYFAKMHGVLSNGSVLVISLLERDYSLHELARIIESNGSKILAMFSDTQEDDPFTILITFKLNLPDISRVIAALQRHNYKVLYTFHKEEFLSKEKERLEHLLRFLEI